MAEFKKALKSQSKLRLGLVGSSGSGKTWTALKVATCLGKNVAVIDTERGSASKYADEFAFDTVQLETFSPDNYIDAIKSAVNGGYDVLIIDSLSHAWTGVGGVMEIVDRATMQSKSHNAFSEGWRKASPLHNKLVDAILQANIHIIVTMRAKTEYVMEDDKNGRKIPRKVGLAPVQRDGMEYEFDIVGDMDADHNFVVSKSRCKKLAEIGVMQKPGDDLAQIVKDWLFDGVTIPNPMAQPPDTKKESPAQVQPQPTKPTAEEGVDPERAKRIAEVVKQAGYDITLKPVREGLIHLVNDKKDRFGALDAKEEACLIGYLTLQIGASNVKAQKEFGKTVLARVKATGEAWGVALANSKTIETPKENETVQDLLEELTK